METGKLSVLFNNAGIMHPADDNALTTPENIWYVRLPPYYLKFTCDVCSNVLVLTLLATLH